MQLGRLLTAARGCRLRVARRLVGHRVLAIIAANVFVCCARLAVHLPVYEVRMLAYPLAFLTTAPVRVVARRPWAATVRPSWLAIV